VFKNATLEYYSPKQSNQYYKAREVCEKSAYMCCPIGNKESHYGIIGVGFDDKKEFTVSKILSLQLICTNLNLIFKGLKNETENWFCL
jgi:hypothetical protein